MDGAPKGAPSISSAEIDAGRDRGIAGGGEEGVREWNW